MKSLNRFLETIFSVKLRNYHCLAPKNYLNVCVMIHLISTQLKNCLWLQREKLIFHRRKKGQTMNISIIPARISGAAHLVGTHIQVHLNRADADATPTSEVEKNDSPKLLFAIICNNFKNYAFVFENKINWLNFIYIQPEVFHQTHQNSVHQRWIDRDTGKIQAKKLELYLVETKRSEKKWRIE